MQDPSHSVSLSISVFLFLYQETAEFTHFRTLAAINPNQSLIGPLTSTLRNKSRTACRWRCLAWRPCLSFLTPEGFPVPTGVSFPRVDIPLAPPGLPRPWSLILRMGLGLFWACRAWASSCPFLPSTFGYLYSGCLYQV